MSFTEMNQDEKLKFPNDEPDFFGKLMNDFISQETFNQMQVNQIINFILSINRNEIRNFRNYFVSFLANPPNFSNEILSSTEILTLIAIALSTFQFKSLNQPINNSFIQSWSKFTQVEEMNMNDLFKLAIIFHHLILIKDISESQLTPIASTFINFLESDCISNKLPISIISYILDILNIFFNEFKNSDLKRKVVSVCFQYVHVNFQPIKMILASNFLITNTNKYNECLQYITQSLQNFNLFHEDSLFYAFSSISKNLCYNLKECSLWSISDTFSAVTSFSITNSYSKIIEEQINSILALNYFGIEKKFNNEMEYFNSSINFLMNEQEEISLNQICESFRFSPVISFRSYQIFTIFFLYSIKIESLSIQLDDKNISEDKVLNLMASFGRNFEYFKAIIDSILFFNHEITNGMLNVINELKNPIMKQFIETVLLFLKFNINFSQKFECPKEECGEYDDDFHVLLDKFGEKCINISRIRKAWEIANYSNKRIFEFLSIFPSSLLAIIYSKYISCLFNEKANQLYVYVIMSFFSSIKNFLTFLISLYKETLKNIENREFIKNAIIFLKWANQIFIKTQQKCNQDEYFFNSTKLFFIKFFEITFSKAYTISLHYSLMKHLFKVISNLMGQEVLFKIIPVDVLINLYFNVPSSNRENKYLNSLMIRMYPSHKSVLSKFEWYHLLLLKYAVLDPKISIPAIKENNLIYDYKNTEEFKKFASDLLDIFDGFYSREIHKIVFEMISYIPAKFTHYSVPAVPDISKYWVNTFYSNQKLLVVNSWDLFKYIREIVTCQKPENVFDDFVDFLDSQKLIENGGFFEIFSFLGLLADSVIKKCEIEEQFLFVQDIFTLIIQNVEDLTQIFTFDLTPAFLAHFLVCLAINDFDYVNKKVNLKFNDTPEYFHELLSEIESVLFVVSYPCYKHATYVCNFFINCFSKSSINFIQLTRFTVNFILRQLDESQLVPSHHSTPDDELRLSICHFLPEKVFDLVIFLKENLYDHNIIEFISLFSVKMTSIASFALCEILSKTNLKEEESTSENNDFFKEKSMKISDYLDKFAEIDLTQIVPLLLLLPEHQEKYVNLYTESLKFSNPKNMTKSNKIPFIFYLLQLPQSVFKNSFEVLKECFLKSSSSCESLVIAECIINADFKRKPLMLDLIVKEILKSNGFYDSNFISNDLTSFKFLFPLFMLQPVLVISAIKDQLSLLMQFKYKSPNLIDSNFKFLLEFLSLPSVVDYLVSNKEYKSVGKILLKIYSTFSFDEINDSMIVYFKFKPKMWSKFVVKNINNEDYVYFFFENFHSDELESISLNIKEKTSDLSEHLQNEFVQYFAIENSEISYKQIKEAFLSSYTQKDRHFIRLMISYLVDNGEIWDLILSFIKTNKLYLIQALKLEILKNDNHDFENLPKFVENVSQENFCSFFDFLFDCYSEFLDLDTFQSILSKIQYKQIPLFEKIFKRYSFKFEFDFNPVLAEGIQDNSNNLNEWNEYENNLFYFRNHDFHKIFSILNSIDLDSPSYIFDEIEKLTLDEKCDFVDTLLIRFINHKNHFISILKFVESNKAFYENPFEMFNNELALFLSVNFSRVNDTNIVECIECFNILCSFLRSQSEITHLLTIWGKKLTDMANKIVSLFVNDDEIFHKNYKQIGKNLVLLVSIFGSQCSFIKTYLGSISTIYYENKSLILQELFECVPEMISHFDDLSESYMNSFSLLLTEIVNENKHLAFPFALLSLNELTQKGFKISKKIMSPFSIIANDEMSSIPISKLNFDFNYPFLNSFKNAFCRWALKDADTDSFISITNKIGQKCDLSNWLIFARSQMNDDFQNIFQSDDQNSHFFREMPLPVIQKYRKLIVDESVIPTYYYRELYSIGTEKNKYKKFFKAFGIDYYGKRIVANSESRVISFESNMNSYEASLYAQNDEISFYTGVNAFIFPFGHPAANVSNVKSSTFRLLQDAMTIIGIPKCYPNQIIERLRRAKDAAFLELKSNEIVQYFCLCSLCKNPIVPPYFTRYHSIKLFEDFNRILNFATTKGINVDFSPLEKSEPLINQSQCSIKNSEKMALVKTKENFLIYAMKNDFENPRIWSDLSAIENNDLLYLFLHSNILPENAQKEVLKQIDQFPFRWNQILFEDIKRKAIHEFFISLVSDVFRIDYSSVFSELLENDEIKKLKNKSFFESKIIDEEHPSHNFNFVVNPMKKLFSVLPIKAPLLPNGPLSSYNFPMHSMFLTIGKENASFASVEICLVNGEKVKYLLTAMIDTFSPNLYVLSNMLNKIIRKRLYCRSKYAELMTPLVQCISKSDSNDDSKLFLVRTNSLPLVKYLVYEDLLAVKREGKFPKLKSFNQLVNFKATKDFFDWESAFLHRFAAFSYLHSGIGLRTSLPFHLLVDEKNASFEFLKLRFPTSDGKQWAEDIPLKFRVFGELVNYFSPKTALEIIPNAMVNVAVSFKFETEKLCIILDNLLGKGYFEKMQAFNEKLQSKNGIKVVEDLISSSCVDIPIIDVPWF